MTADAHTLGIQGKTLVGAAGSTPTVALGDEIDVTLDCVNEMAAFATRGKPRKNHRPTTQEISAAFNCVKDFTNASFVLLHAAAMGRTAIAMKFLDKTSGYGWDGDWYVSCKEGQPLEGWTTCDFEAKHTYDLRDLTEINPS